MMSVQGDVDITKETIDHRLIMPSVTTPASLVPDTQAVELDRPNYLYSARLLLKQQKYADVVQLLRSITLVGDTTLSQQIRKTLLMETEVLIGQQQYKVAVELITSYLEYYFDDHEALISLGKVQVASGNILEGIKQWYDAKAYVSGNAELKRIDELIHNIVQNHRGRLIKNSAWRDVIALYQFLILQAPDVSSYYVELAEAQIQLGDWIHAEQTLDIIRHDASFSAEVNDLVAKIELHQQEVSLSESGIALERRHGNYLVKVQLNGTTETTLLIDTGATLTSLTPRALGRAGLSFPVDATGRAVVNTANGQVEARIFRLEELSISGISVQNLEVLALEMDNMNDIDGLLGMNYLQHFEFMIDQNRDKLYLKSR